MIQRIQTVYLLLITILAVLFLSGNILLFSDGSAITFSGVSDTTMANDSKSIPLLSAILALVPIVSFVTIFIFKNRKLQIQLILALVILILIEIATVAYLAYTLVVAHSAELGPGPKMVLPPVMLVLAFLAYRGIKKDENLVKSYDRLR